MLADSPCPMRVSEQRESADRALCVWIYLPSSQTLQTVLFNWPVRSAVLVVRPAPL